MRIFALSLTNSRAKSCVAAMKKRKKMEDFLIDKSARKRRKH
jgi:hypothetical protein